jgi:hypothetical protein
MVGHVNEVHKTYVLLHFYMRKDQAIINLSSYRILIPEASPRP